MTLAQARALYRYLRGMECETLHHGDCIGSDETAHYIAKALGCRIVIHPPSNPKKRARCEGDEMRGEKPYLNRNCDIVDESEYLVATPKERQEMVYSGTWSTVRHARRTKKPINVIYP